MGEPGILHLSGFGILGRVPEPQNRFGDTRIPKKIKKTIGTCWRNVMFINLKISEIHVLTILEKMDTETFLRPV